MAALLFGSACAATAEAQTTTIELSNGSQLTVVGSFSQEELDRKMRELEAAIAGVPLPTLDAQGRPFNPLANSTQRRGTSRITGRIANSNGSPLRQATVRASATNLGVFKETMTDQDGRYELRDLPAGHYTVTAEKPNYVALAYGQLQLSDFPKRVEVANNEVVDRIDISLSRGGVITGRVLDEFGEPLTDVPVGMVRKSVSPGQLRPMPTGRTSVTNDLGEYRIFGLQPGQYYVSATPRQPSGSDTGADSRNAYAPTYYPGTPMFSSATPVTVGMNETISGMDVPVVAVRLATISGTVIDSQGAPARMGNITATERNGNLATSSGAAVRPDGTFTLPPLPPGEYFLRASLPVPPPPRPPDLSLPVPAEKLRALMAALPPAETLVANVIVNGSDVGGVVLTPMRRVNISGRVVFDAPGARLPTPGALRLSIVPRSPEASVVLGGFPIVSDDFTFQFNVPAAELALRATVGSADWALKTIRMSGVDITDTGVDLRTSSQNVNVEIEFTGHPPELSGLAVDRQGQAIEDYGVLVFPQDRERWILDSRLVTTIRADPDGRYKVRTLPPGRYFIVLLTAQEVGSLQNFLQNFDLEPMIDRATAFSLGENERKSLDLRSR